MLGGQYKKTIYKYARIATDSYVNMVQRTMGHGFAVFAIIIVPFTASGTMLPIERVGFSFLQEEAREESSIEHLVEKVNDHALGLTEEIIFTFTQPIDVEKIDLALHIGSSPDDSSLISEPLLREHLQIFASPEFLNNYSNTDSLEDLLKMPWILLKQMMNSKGLPLLSTNSSINFNLNPPRAHRVDSPIVMIEQIKMGLGVGLVFPSIVHREIKNGELVQILPDWHSNEMLFSVLYSTRRQMPIRVKTFLDFLTA